MFHYKLTQISILLDSLSHLYENFSNALELSLVMSLAFLGLICAHLLHCLHGGVEVCGELVENFHLGVAVTK